MTSPGRLAKKTAVAVVGGATVATGLVLIPLPGPGTLITIGGLAILGTEFPAAKRLVGRMKKAVGDVVGMKGAEADDDSKDTEPRSSDAA